MSLVNEALRKARQDAARRDAENRGSLPLAAPVHMPATGQSSLLSPVVIVLGVLLVLSILLLVVLLARPRDRSAEAVAAEVAGTAEAGTAEVAGTEPSGAPKATSPSPTRDGDVAGGAGGDVRNDEKEGGEPAEVVTAQVPPQSAAPADFVAASPPQEEPAPALPPPAKTISTPSASAKAPAQPAGMRQTYRKRVELPDGTEIKLDFIVWSERNPFAQLNGQLARPGEEVGELGYKVLAIDRKGVRLEGPAGTFVIRLQ